MADNRKFRDIARRGRDTRYTAKGLPYRPVVGKRDYETERARDDYFGADDRPEDERREGAF